MKEPSRQVLVILDREFGERLRDVWPGRAVWVAESPANEPVVRSLWTKSSNADHLSGITLFRVEPDQGPEQCLLSQLPEIDLHHGPYSSNAPYTSLEVIGTPLTASIREHLGEFGFSGFRDLPQGFTAERSDAEAKRLRN